MKLLNHNINIDENLYICGERAENDIVSDALDNNKKKKSKNRKQNPAALLQVKKRHILHRT